MTPRLRSPLVLGCLSVLVGAPANAAPNHNVIFHSNLDQYAGYANVWGYTAPSGDEYALLGATTGLSVINVTDPDAPFETGFIPGPNSTWRELKTYQQYCYVGTEGGGGIQIVSLANPESPVLVNTYTGAGVSSSHTVYVDEGAGILYINGSNLGAGGMRLVSLADPVNPVEVGSWEINYVHDCMARNGRCYAASIYDGILYVLNVANPASIPAALGTAQGYPGAFTHNAWLTEGDAYVLTTDETTSSATRMWDLATLPTLVETDSFDPPGSSIPHNVHVDGDIAFVSHYTLGVKILDISNPADLVEVGAYDTWPADDGGTFDGCWGVFPYFQTNEDLLVLSDRTTGLWVLEFKGPLGTVAGEVRRAGNPSVKIAGATVEVVETGVSVQTNGVGQYTLQDTAGAVNMQAEAFGYEPHTEPVTITSSVTTPLDFELTLLPSGSLTGTITDGTTTFPLLNAQVEILTTPLVDASDGSGLYLHDAIPVGSWRARVSAFGYNPKEAQITMSAGGLATVDFPLNPAPVADDFQSAFPGWAVSGGVTSGAWVRGDPEPTNGGSVQPGDDHTPAPGTICWVTGPTAGPGVGSFDVDNGSTILTSPSFPLASANDPHVSYWKWYQTGVAGNLTRDTFSVRVSQDGGGSWVVLEDTDAAEAAWVHVDVALNSLITPTNLVRFEFTARDTGAGSITEALIDDFVIYDGPDTLVVVGAPAVGPAARTLTLEPSWPNPFRFGQITTAELLVPAAGRVLAEVLDVSGRRVATLANLRMEAGRHRVRWDGLTNDGRVGAAGVYFLRIRSGDQERSGKILLLR